MPGATSTVGVLKSGVLYHFGLYALSRPAHAYFLPKGRQPHRNRGFSLGIAVLFALVGHIVTRVLRFTHRKAQRRRAPSTCSFRRGGEGSS